MTFIASPLAYAAAAFLATLMLTDPSRADSTVLTAQASPTPAPATTTNQMSGPAAGAKPVADNPVEARITELHAKLAITSAQEDLWSHVTQVMRDNEQAMESLHRTRSERATTMTAIEDVKSYAAIAEAHADGLKKFAPVFEALYASMSDAQKKNADTLFSSRDPMANKNTKSKKK
jgi:hypothetical protein